MAVPGKIASYSGVLEYWSVGESDSPNISLNEFSHCSITPPLHHSRRPSQGGKSTEAPSEVIPEPGRIGQDSLFGMIFSVQPPH